MTNAATDTASDTATATATVTEAILPVMQRVQPWILAILAGVTLALALPGPGLWPLALLFPGLLLESLERVKGRWRPWVLGWLAGTIHWVVATHWVHEVMHHYGGLPWLGALGALFGMGLILGTLWAVVVGATALVPAPWRIWLLPAAWVAVDALRRFQPFQFPWNDIAVVLADTPALLGSLPVWGASGLAWALMAAGAGLWGAVRQDRRPAAAALVIAAVGGVVTASALAPPFEACGQPIRVAVLQPGTTLEEKWDPGKWKEISDRTWNLTRHAADAGAEVVVWPESAVPFRLDTDAAYRRIVTELAADLEVQIVLNSIGDLGGGGYANSAYLITGEGIAPVRYDKVHLVPFGEYVPPWAALVASDALVREVGGFSPGDEVRVLPATVPLGVAVCYEIVFSEHTAAAVLGGAQIVATLTNDGWYGFSWAPAQHFAQAVMRAVEHRRFVVRAALTGISGFVDPYGGVIDRLDVGDQGLLVAELRPSTSSTPRPRWGDWWWSLCAVATLAGLVASAVSRRQARASGQNTSE